MSKIIITEKEVLEIQENLYQIHALGNVCDVCGEPQENLNNLQRCGLMVGSTVSELGQIIKKLAIETLDIVGNIKGVL